MSYLQTAHQLAQEYDGAMLVSKIAHALAQSYSNGRKSNKLDAEAADLLRQCCERNWERPDVWAPEQIDALNEKIHRWAEADNALRLDKCQMCLGRKGGVRGNENRVGDVIMCDYCTSLFDKARRTQAEREQKAAQWYAENIEGRPLMILCPTCGNKRCPHANNPNNECTGSNEPGQPGSAYEFCGYLIRDGETCELAPMHEGDHMRRKIDT